jgi:hypothetical protein
MCAALAHFETRAKSAHHGWMNESLLSELEKLERDATPGPWVSSVEGRDHVAGDNAIFTADDPRQVSLLTEHGLDSRAQTSAIFGMVEVVAQESQ